MACFVFFDPIYRGNSINPYLAKMCIKFNFISMCSYFSGVCSMYCIFFNYFRSLLYLNVVLRILVIHWMRVSLIRKKWWLNDNWRQTRIIEELISTTSDQCYLGNKYLIHALFSSIQPHVGCILAWNFYLQKLCFLQRS
jgi:hypothetical protein